MKYYPRKGAKTARSPKCCYHAWYHPRKGAKTSGGSGRRWAGRYHPRKGAKTRIKMVCLHRSRYHPRKGAIAPASLPELRGSWYNPRKGTKNSASKKMRSFSFTNLNFLFSVGCPSMNGTIAAAVIFSLLRLLHGDKMCYNKANSKHLLQNRQIHFPFIVQLFHNP